MRFNLKKLPIETVDSLRQITLESVEPFRPLPAPVYLLMSKNQKFVSIKGPLDFFTPRDLDRLKSVETLYFGEFLDRVQPFRDAARKTRSILSWSGPTGTGVLEPTPYELSDSILRVMGGLWAKLPGDDPNLIGIESYFAVAFANELCDPLPGDRMMQAREADVDRYELALLRSGVAVFFALHLGYIDLSTLNGLRYRVFVENVKLGGLSALLPFSKELEDLNKWVNVVVHGPEITTISSDQFQWSLNRTTQKLKSRLQRVRQELLQEDYALQSVYGDGGIFLKPEETEELEAEMEGADV